MGKRNASFKSPDSNRTWPAPSRPSMSHQPLAACLPALRSFFSALCIRTATRVWRKKRKRKRKKRAAAGDRDTAQDEGNTVAIPQGRTLQLHVAAAFLLPFCLSSPCTSTVGLRGSIPRTWPQGPCLASLRSVYIQVFWPPLFLYESPVSRHHLQTPVSFVSIPTTPLRCPPFSRPLNTECSISTAPSVENLAT
ncbi:hypothetical protein LX36DRAFT_75497 [Colletotrichum falcatum]|nr:hypothetical protein LX36DRAFT_75497 [Colletotrichum falcatum]